MLTETPNYVCKHTLSSIWIYLKTKVKLNHMWLVNQTVTENGFWIWIHCLTFKINDAYTFKVEVDLRLEMLSDRMHSNLVKIHVFKSDFMPYGCSTNKKHSSNPFNALHRICVQDLPESVICVQEYVRCIYHVCWWGLTVAGNLTISQR